MNALDEEYTDFDLLPKPCPVCGDAIDYCLGHGEIGDPEGHKRLLLHDDGDHLLCHPAAECSLHHYVHYSHATWWCPTCDKPSEDCVRAKEL